jgi:hypothetical protein
VLARTNAQLSPYAAVAVEMGIPYRAAEDGLLLDDPAIDAALAALPDEALPALALSSTGRSDAAGTAMIAWATAYQTAGEFKSALAAARQRRAELRRDDADLVLATAHGTKGLEFDHVACIGLDEGTFPSGRTIAESDDPKRALEEERRLAYVAWTRARKSLLLVYDPGAPSIFLREAFSDEELGLVR